MKLGCGQAKLAIADIYRPAPLGLLTTVARRLLEPRRTPLWADRYSFTLEPRLDQAVEELELQNMFNRGN